MARAEEGVHRALAVGGDEDQATRGRCAFLERRRLIGDAERAQIVREDMAELVVGNLADEGAALAEHRHARAAVFAADPPDTSTAGPIAA